MVSAYCEGFEFSGIIHPQNLMKSRFEHGKLSDGIRYYPTESRSEQTQTATDSASMRLFETS